MSHCVPGSSVRAPDPVLESPVSGLGAELVAGVLAGGEALAGSSVLEAGGGSAAACSGGLCSAGPGCGGAASPSSAGGAASRQDGDGAEGEDDVTKGVPHD